MLLKHFTFIITHYVYTVMDFIILNFVFTHTHKTLPPSLTLSLPLPSVPRFFFGAFFFTFSDIMSFIRIAHRTFMKKMFFLRQLSTAYTFSKKREAPPSQFHSKVLAGPILCRPCGYRYTSCEVRSRADVQRSKVRVQCCPSPIFL